MTTYTRRICLALACVVNLAAFSFAQDWTELPRRQREELPIESGTLKEIQGFSEKNSELSAEYAEALARQLRDISLSESEAQLKIFQQGRCAEEIDVDFFKDGLKLKDFPRPAEAAEKEFEKGFMRVEVVFCFPDIERSAKEALLLYTSPEFRLSVSSTLKNIEEKEGISCVETKGIPAILPATLYCNRVRNFFADGLASQHSQVVENPEPEAYQHIYFKESLKTFVELPEGGLGFHYINYSRSNRLGALKRGLGKNSVIASQKKALEKLRARLGTRHK